MTRNTEGMPAQTEALAALIRKVDGRHDLSAAALAERLVERGVNLGSGNPEELAEENRLMYAAINRMAWRMDKRAEEAEKAGAVHIAKLYRACADIVTEELKGAAEVQP